MTLTLLGEVSFKTAHHISDADICYYEIVMVNFGLVMSAVDRLFSTSYKVAAIHRMGTAKLLGAKIKVDF